MIDPRIADWVGDRLGFPIKDPHRKAIGVIVGSELRAGAAFTHFEGRTARVSGCAESPAWASLNVLKFVANYIFRDLGLERIEARAGRKNKRARSFLERFGFVYEGMAKRGYHDGTDAAVYRMLDTECKWLETNG